MALTSRLSPTPERWLERRVRRGIDTMIPSSLIAGLLIGIANDSWLAVITVCFIWSLVFCVYVSMFDTRRKTATISHFENTGQKADVGHVTYRSILFHRV